MLAGAGRERRRRAIFADIRAEKAPVSGLARPAPVIRLPAEDPDPVRRAYARGAFWEGILAGGRVVIRGNEGCDTRCRGDDLVNQHNGANGATGVSDLRSAEQRDGG